MNYGRYKKTRNAAWQCLVDYKIDSFPVNVSKIARDAKVKVIRNSDVNLLKPNENGKSYFDGQTWFLIYDDTNDPVVSRFTIAHELGHFFLGHAYTCAKYADYDNKGKKPKAEDQADAFALRLLCPACVLKDLNISSAEDIAKYCRVPIEWAEKRYIRLKELKERDKFFTDPLEREVYDNFIEYLKLVNRKPKNKNRPLGR